jgi:hypothetical protein
MAIACDIIISNPTARKYGLNSGGIAHYESLPLDKNALLDLNEEYRNGCLVIEEINVQYSNVRRNMANTNIEFNEVCQQLRKFKTSLIYNVIDEMFIDPQLRALTDIFIRTYDTAFDLDALENKKQPGLDFCWKVYPMTGYLCGEQGRYAITHQALYPVYFHFGEWRGIYNSDKHQEKGVYSYNKREKEALMRAQMITESSDEMNDVRDEWGWVGEGVRKLKNSGVREIVAYQLWQVLEIAEHGKTPIAMGQILPAYGVHRSRQDKKGNWIYKIEDFSLDDTENQPTGARGAP